MKKFLLFACITLSISVFSQSADKSDVEKLRHDIKIVQAENTKLKNEIRDSINSIEESLGNLKKLYQTANTEIKTDENSLGAATSSLAQLNDYTNTKFNRHRGIIKAAIIVGLLAIILSGIMIVILYFKARRNVHEIAKNYELNLTAWTRIANDIDKKFEINNELFDTKINNERKININEIRDVKNSCESLVNKAKEELKDQLKKDITSSFQLALSQLNEVREATTADFKIMNERLTIFEKIIKDKK